MCKLTAIKSDRRSVELLKSEQKAQLYFLIGLLINRKTSAQPDEQSAKLTVLACLTRSSLICKPNKFTCELESSTLSSKRSVEDDLLKLLLHECALRFSIIGNWLRFFVDKQFNSDQIELAEQLQTFCANNDVGS